MAELPNKETLTVEFKSDRKRLPDDDLVTTAVAMANTEGGVIYLGLEDDGTATGLHLAHQPPDGIAALVGNRTVPSVQVRIETLAVEGKWRFRCLNGRKCGPTNLLVRLCFGSWSGWTT